MSAQFVVSADGGSRGNPGPAAYGTLVSDSAGNVIVEIAEFFDHETNNFAEYRGAIAGLEYVHAIDPDARIDVRLDSKLVVEQMSGRWKIKSDDIRSLALRARDAHDPTLVTYTWIPREENTTADALVNEMLDSALDGGERSIRRTSERLDGDMVGDAPEDQARAELAESPKAAQPPRTMIGWADVGKPTEILLVRHGATKHSLEKKFSGSGGDDPPLIDLGIEQGRSVAAALADSASPAAIVSSPMKRAQETAAFIAEATGLDVTIDEGLAECSFGVWDGHTFADVRATWPHELADWLASTSVAPPEGESFDDCQVRVRQARERIVERYPGQTVIVVSHVSPIKLMITDAVGAPVDSIYRMELPPCSISRVAWFPDGNSSMFSFADVAHLKELRGPDGT